MSWYLIIIITFSLSNFDKRMRKDSRELFEECGMRKRNLSKICFALQLVVKHRPSSPPTDHLVDVTKKIPFLCSRIIHKN